MFNFCKAMSITCSDDLHAIENLLFEQLDSNKILLYYPSDMYEVLLKLPRMSHPAHIYPLDPCLDVDDDAGVTDIINELHGYSLTDFPYGNYLLIQNYSDGTSLINLPDNIPEIKSANEIIAVRGEMVKSLASFKEGYRNGEGTCLTTDELMQKWQDMDNEITAYDLDACTFHSD